MANSRFQGKIFYDKRQFGMNAANAAIVLIYVVSRVVLRKAKPTGKWGRKATGLMKDSRVAYRIGSPAFLV